MPQPVFWEVVDWKAQHQSFQMRVASLKVAEDSLVDLDENPYFPY
jgi:hypothetical protein